MALSTIEEHLQLVLQQEAVDFEPSALQHLARAARGSMRDALSLTDQAIAYGAGQLQEAVVRQMLGAVDREHVIRLLQALALGDGAAMVQAVDGVRKLGLSASGTLDELVSALQHMAMVQAVPDLAAQDAQSQPYAELASRFAADETQLFYSLALQGRQELPLAPDEYAGLTMIVLRWLAFKPGRQVARPPDPPKAEGPTSVADAGPASTPPWEDEVVAPVAVKVAAEVAAQLPPMPTSEMGDRWFEVVSKLQQQGLIAALVRELAMQAECVRVDDQPDGSRWTLRVERESLRHDSHRERLTQALVQLLGGQVQLVLESGAVRDTPAMREQAARARRQAAAEKLISQDPLVVALLDNYPGAKIVPGSVVPL